MHILLILAIVIGALIVLALLILLVVWLWRRFHTTQPTQTAQESRSTQASHPMPDIYADFVREYYHRFLQTIR